MSFREVKKHILNIDRTLPYFLNHIKCGKTLSKKIVQEINFKEGVFFTLLPSDAFIDRIYEFSCGGIIPVISAGNQFYCAEESSHTFRSGQVITMDHECSEYIDEYLKDKNQNRAVIENVISEPGDPYVNIKNVELMPFQKEVYYFLDAKNSFDDIYLTIRKSGQVWHFLCVLTAVDKMLKPPLKEEALDQFCKHAKIVIAGAYDGEGYVFWERRNG